MLDDGHADAVSPDGQLFRGSGTEGIAGGEHDRFPLLFVILGQFADSRRLTDTIDADDEDDPRPFRFREEFIVFIEQGDDAFFQIRYDVVAVFDFLRFDAGPYLVQEILRRFDADVSGEHDRFQVIVHVVVYFGIAADDGFDVLDERVFRLF